MFLPYVTCEKVKFVFCSFVIRYSVALLKRGYEYCNFKARERGGSKRQGGREMGEREREGETGKERERGGRGRMGGRESREGEREGKSEGVRERGMGERRGGV